MLVVTSSEGSIDSLYVDITSKSGAVKKVESPKLFEWINENKGADEKNDREKIIIIDDYGNELKGNVFVGNLLRRIERSIYQRSS